MKLSVVIMTLALVLGGVNAEAAKRLGGGKSMGKQSTNVTQREAAPTPPAAPAQSAAATKPGTPAATPAAAAPSRPWGAMLGGLAAGLGLAWLAHSLGFGEAFGQVLMFILLAVGVMLIIGMIMRSRKASSSGNSPFAFQGAGQGGSPANAASRRPYRPENVGNDASARPFERSQLPQMDSAAASGGSMIGSALMGSQSWGVPAGFDADGFLKAAKANFVTLQAAWDRSDIATLRSMMTDSMLLEIQTQLAERGQLVQGPNLTEVVMLEAQLLGIEDLGEGYMASIEFSGMIREEPNTSPSPFREVWNMTKPKTGAAGWLVAGVQALQ